MLCVRCRGRHGGTRRAALAKPGPTSANSLRGKTEAGLWGLGAFGSGANSRPASLPATYARDSTMTSRE